MKFAVIIPSLNEADSIGYVAKTIDEGIISNFDNNDFLIINADGPSTDDTKDAFLKTSTETSKEYLNCSTMRIVGKGTNILLALEKYISEFDGFLLIDADLTSIDKSWVKAFIEPIASKEAHFVSPIYKRNRYEGNTTNHFSFPLIKILTDSNINQPIAGDFAFSKQVAKQILVAPKNTSDYEYGIDTLISWTVSLGNFSTKEILLDKKIHKPSFGKIVPMFTQICETTLSVIQKNRHKLKNKVLNSRGEMVMANCISDDFIAKPEVMKINLLKKFVIDEQSRIKSLSFSNTYQKYLNKSQLDEEEWSTFLADVLITLLEGSNSNFEIKRTNVFIVTLAYLLRVIGYFNQIEYLTSDEIHQLLQKQTNLIRRKVLAKLTK